MDPPPLPNRTPQSRFTTPAPPSPTTKPTSSLARRRRSSVLTSPSTVGTLGMGFTSAPSTPNGAGGGGFGGYGFGGVLGAGSMGVEREAERAMMEMEMETEGMGMENQTEGGEDSFDHISQAMTLLSLHPPPPPTTSSPTPEAYWPDTEDLLKESLRQSLSALRALQAAKRYPPSAPGEKMRAVEAAMVEMRGARQMLVWAEQQAEVEKREVAERGLKGCG
ncbi:hypothetical protein EX30DRAFT_71788 [Ascodesmis nigricans]|uniref:Uncharacterized protein n=1 Tax=Ascodesmis nigricans TaxID=341454 RepID=A0A4V3SIG3_9PEZI|nr:hypothetical protein EX30DRAFT_71788 [Ascodesmis nigricans]